MAADTLILIYGRPFEAGDERAIGNGPLAELEALETLHPDLVHRPSAPGGGGWWIGRASTVLAPITLPLPIQSWLGNPTCLLEAESEEEVEGFCNALPAIIRDHPLLAGLGTYLIRKD